MAFEDLDPPKKKPELLFRNLETLSVEGLAEYRVELKAELVRVDEEEKKRGSARSKAESFFASNKNS